MLQTTLMRADDFHTNTPASCCAVVNMLHCCTAWCMPYVLPQLTVTTTIDRKRGASLALYIAKRKPMKFPSTDVRASSFWPGI